MIPIEGSFVSFFLLALRFSKAQSWKSEWQNKIRQESGVTQNGYFSEIIFDGKNRGVNEEVAFRH